MLSFPAGKAEAETIIQHTWNQLFMFPTAVVPDLEVRTPCERTHNESKGRNMIKQHRKEKILFFY